MPGSGTTAIDAVTLVAWLEGQEDRYPCGEWDDGTDLDEADRAWRRDHGLTVDDDDEPGDAR